MVTIVTGPALRRALVVTVALAVSGLAACDPAAPPPQPPTSPAPAGSWRAATETWVVERAFPVVLGRPGAVGDGRLWADRAVRSSPGAAARTIAATHEARRRQATFAYQLAFDRTPSSADQDWWAGQITSGRWTNDRMVSHLLGSPEQTGRTPGDGEWVDWTFARLLGRSPDAGARAHFTNALAGGSSRATVARGILGSDEGRNRATALTYQDALGRAPTAAERTMGTTILRGTAGDLLRLRADIVSAQAPAGYTVGVVGDSIGFDLVFRSSGQALPAVVTGRGQRPVGAGRLGCGVLSTHRGWQWELDGRWSAPGGSCPDELPRFEGQMLDRDPGILVWQIGAWEWTRVRRANGTVIPARSTEMRNELVAEMVRRADGWAARGVRRVLLPGWACVGSRSAEIPRHPGYARFIHSVITEAASRRPNLIFVARTPPQVCVDGVYDNGRPTREHRAARGDQYHWVAGSGGAAWGWTYWFAPAIADLPGLR